MQNHDKIEHVPIFQLTISYSVPVNQAYSTRPKLFPVTCDAHYLCLIAHDSMIQYHHAPSYYNKLNDLIKSMSN